MLEVVECFSKYSRCSHYHSKRFRRCAFEPTHSHKETLISEIDSTQATDFGDLCKESFLLLSRECTMGAGHGRRQNNMFGDPRKGLGRFHVCYIWSCFHSLNS